MKASGCRHMCLYLRGNKTFTNSSPLQSPTQYHKWKIVWATTDPPKSCLTQSRLLDSTPVTSCLSIQEGHIDKLSEMHCKNLSSQLSCHTCCRNGMKKSEMCYRENGKENCCGRQEIASQKFASGNIQQKWSDAHRNQGTGNLNARTCVSGFGNYGILSNSQMVNKYSSPHQARLYSNWHMHRKQISHNAILSHGGKQISHNALLSHGRKQISHNAILSQGSYHNPSSIPSRTITTSCPHLMELKSMDDFKGPTLSQMTSYLKKNKLSCHIGYTCLVMECAFCEDLKCASKLSSAKSAVGKQAKENISERNLYINMTTGKVVLYSNLAISFAFTGGGKLL